MSYLKNDNKMAYNRKPRGVKNQASKWGLEWNEQWEWHNLVIDI